MTTEQRLTVSKLPVKDRRAALRGMVCEICKTKPARNILPLSNALCCVDRAIRCPGQPAAGDVCYGCGSPATAKTKSGFVCGSDRHTGCAKVAEKQHEEKAKTISERMEDEGFRDRRQSRYESTMLKRHGATNIMQAPELRAKFEKTSMENYGVANPAQAAAVKAKKVRNSLERHGVEHPSQLESTKAAFRQTCQERYGVDNVSQSEKLRQKWEADYAAKHGVHHPMMVPENKAKQQESMADLRGDNWEKSKETLSVKYGVVNPMNHPDALNNRDKTNLQKYGVENPASLDETIAKIQQTNLERYGVKYAISNPDVYRSIYLPGFYRIHELVLPSGRTVKYQGYEDRAILKLLRTFSEDEILFNGDLAFEWTDPEGDKHTYFPDLCVRPKQTAVEVKSEYTLAASLADGTLLQKLLAVRFHGWLPVVQVWGKDGDDPSRVLTLDDFLAR